MDLYSYTDRAVLGSLVLHFPWNCRQSVAVSQCSQHDAHSPSGDQPPAPPPIFDRFYLHDKERTRHPSLIDMSGPPHPLFWRFSSRTSTCSTDGHSEALGRNKLFAIMLWDARFSFDGSSMHRVRFRTHHHQDQDARENQGELLTRAGGLALEEPRFDCTYSLCTVKLTRSFKRRILATLR